MRRLSRTLSKINEHNRVHIDTPFVYFFLLPLSANLSHAGCSADIFSGRSEITPNKLGVLCKTWQTREKEMLTLSHTNVLIPR